MVIGHGQGIEIRLFRVMTDRQANKSLYPTPGSGDRSAARFTSPWPRVSELLLLSPAVKVLALILLCMVSGCANHERLSVRQSDATTQVRRWVPKGTPLADARRIMEHHGFSCSVVTNGPSRLDCYYRSSGSFWSEGMVQVCGHASFPVVDGRVSAADVTTYLKGP